MQHFKVGIQQAHLPYILSFVRTECTYRALLIDSIFRDVAMFLSSNSGVNNSAVMKFLASSSSVVTRKATLSPGCKVTIYS